MHQLKDIARRMDNCHPRTAKRWWKKLDWECEAAGLPRVAPDVPGHGAHRWHDATADRLIALWENYFKTRGLTPAQHRAKFKGTPLPSGRQLELALQDFLNFNELTPEQRLLARTMEETDTRPKARSHAKTAGRKKAAGKSAQGRVAAAQS